MQSLANFWHANKPFCVLLVHMVLSAIVATTPKRYQNKPFWGIFLTIAHWQSSLTHYDEKGSLQLPVLRKAIGFGQKFLAAADTALINPPTDSKSE